MEDTELYHETVSKFWPQLTRLAKECYLYNRSFSDLELFEELTKRRRKRRRLLIIGVLELIGIIGIIGAIGCLIYL